MDLVSALVTQIGEHPWVFASIVAVALSTILNLYLEYYADDSPKLSKALRYIIDLLALVSAKGHSWQRGVKLPVVSTSGPPPARPTGGE